ncbi:MAG: hypothetical protein A4E53_03023 [Pelotomaculum sp. PtaB.Bin104]|nr:MAG: hypothetical protein A4E53_03023 [Pelotomaculum sp. PtaB.Bin104]
MVAIQGGFSKKLNVDWRVLIILINSSFVLEEYVDRLPKVIQCINHVGYVCSMYMEQLIILYINQF